MLRGDALTVAGQLRGETLQIPALLKTFSGWPRGANKHLNDLRDRVSTFIQKYTACPKKSQALQKADFGLLIALWYPEALWSELETMAAFSVWIFAWDDEVDEGDTITASQEDFVHAYSQQSLQYIRKELNLPENRETIQDNFANIIETKAQLKMALFGVVGNKLRTAMDLVQRERFYRELEHYIQSVEEEHIFRLRGAMPSIEQYLQIRSGSVGCRPFLALAEFMLRTKIPEQVMDSVRMQSLWVETVNICFMLNDVYSVQKEMAQHSLLNIIPVLSWNDTSGEGGLGKVTRDFMVLLESSRTRFEQAAESLQQEPVRQGVLGSDVEAFIQGCRYFTTGALLWSLESPRYNMAKYLQEDESLCILL
ncbi:terpenoid synthase [Thozetella sp. PMI_491]|nr:terpenoid synthase [Thozetella sp. PMI_491]